MTGMVVEGGVLVEGVILGSAGGLALWAACVLYLASKAIMAQRVIQMT